MVLMWQVPLVLIVVILALDDNKLENGERANVRAVFMPNLWMCELHKK